MRLDRDWYGNDDEGAVVSHQQPVPRQSLTVLGWRRGAQPFLAVGRSGAGERGRAASQGCQAANSTTSAICEYSLIRRGQEGY